MNCHPILIDGEWRPARAKSTFQACDPMQKEHLPEHYPVSEWSDCEDALAAATRAAEQMRQLPAERMAHFLETFAGRIERRAAELTEMAHRETGLPVAPRLADVELPRTTGQLRQAAAACRDGSWTAATIDSQTNIRSHFDAIGPVCVFGPNNFPFAFGSVTGGDAAAALAAGNPVIGKANSSHPGTTRLFAEAAVEAIRETEMPPATVQMIYRLNHQDGERLVSDPRVGATGYTGSRQAGLKLKSAADKSGKPIYLELSSINPVVILRGALQERANDIAQEFIVSGLMGTGQFCTNPGLLVLTGGESTESFIDAITAGFADAPPGVLLSQSVQQSLQESIRSLRDAGATSLAGDGGDADNGFSCQNTLLRISGDQFLANPEGMQIEAFGNCTLIVVAESTAQIAEIAGQLEGNLTGCIYSDRGGADDDDYAMIAGPLRRKVGRLLNDKMPTGVAVSPAMNHGGPYPATGHPGYTAVGIPAAIHRFAMLSCYDNVRPHRLPQCLQDKNPNGTMWRRIDGIWTQADVTS